MLLTESMRRLKTELQSEADRMPGLDDTATPEFMDVSRLTTMEDTGTRADLSTIDFNCPLCADLLYKPVTTPCGHTFCKVCLDTSFSYKRECPMCREAFLFSAAQVKTNVLLASILEQNFTKAYIARGVEVEQQYLEQREGRKKILIGNTHEVFMHNSRNSHKWKFFVMALDMGENIGDVPQVPSSYYVDRVDLHLHPSFTPNRVILTGDTLEIQRVGWGVFTLRGTVYFQSRFNLPPMAFEHLLSFERNGTHRCFTVEFKSK